MILKNDKSKSKISSELINLNKLGITRLTKEELEQVRGGGDGDDFLFSSNNDDTIRGAV